MLELNTSNCTPFLPEDWLTSRLDALESARVKLEEGSGLGGAYTGWVHLPRDYDKEEFARIQAAAERIRSDSQALVVIGIGGSYLGARAVVELLHSPNFNLTHKGGPDIYFAGNGLSSDAMLEVIELVKDKDFSINVISKSGTTTEPAVAFRIFKALLEEKYGKEGARRRIYATTDAHKGALKGLADAEGYEEFVVPDAVGGRYSVLTAVGLLPIACAGVDIAAQAMEALAAPGADNPAWQYAAARHALYTQGKKVEILVGYEPSFRFFGEWWKQLFGETEGKDGKALFPASVEFTADLHSMGQYIQQGERLMLDGGALRPQPRQRHHSTRPGQCGRAQLPSGQGSLLCGRTGHAGHPAGPRGRRRAQPGGHRPGPGRAERGLADLLLRVRLRPVWLSAGDQSL